jgi:hypothetical protein
MSLSLIKPFYGVKYQRIWWGHIFLDNIRNPFQEKCVHEQSYSETTDSKCRTRIGGREFLSYTQLFLWTSFPIVSKKGDRRTDSRTQYD